MKGKESTSKKFENLKGDEIVITGVAGCFPDAENIQKLCENLYNKIDMVSKCKDYENIKHLELPKYFGKIKGMEKFDSQFFRVTHWQAASYDPVGRKLLEETFSAIFDAGINPETLKGSRLGVFMSGTQSDASYLSLYYGLRRNAFIISGCSKAMLANRISYWIDGKGPSLSIDHGCAGSMSALEMAYNRMKNGEIDCAIVGGSNLCIIPLPNVLMKRAQLLCLDGKTKCFDKNGDGYARSDAINVYFLQKAKDAKRIYAEVFYVKGEYFPSPDGSFSINRSPKDLEKFLKDFYSEIDFSPENVEYVEANSFGIAEADGNELEAIGNVFGKDKTIKIGSVKSNMGNTESASGACSITKMCLAYQNGKIPANLHYNDPQNHITPIKEGRLQVVTDNEHFNRGYTAINNFCYTGANFHTLLKGHYKPKDADQYTSKIPRLVLVSGRQEDSVNKICDFLETNPIDIEQCALLNNIFKYNIPGHTGRGYTIIDSKNNENTVSLSRSFELYSGYTPPVWFLYSGMGSEWAGMGEGLLSIPVFAAAIKRCHKVLKPKGLDIFKILTNRDSENVNILNSLVAINAVQIGLTDVLMSLGIIPDKIIGHSIGELGCAYADGALTAEQTILATWCRATVSFKTEFIKGKMAAVGLGYKEVEQLCPPEIHVACHNSYESATISGPADVVTEYIKSFSAQGIFVKEVNSYNIAFHSKYIAEAGPAMLKILKQFITEPKLRSEKWLSTCYLPKDWDKPESKYASGEYFTHNLMSSVLFEEAAKLIPVDAIIIEIAPHGLLQSIMKRSHSQCFNLSLTRRDVKDSIHFFLEAIGRLYQKGLNPDIDALYPKVEFPVSSETPTLSHLVVWDHSVIWPENTINIKENPKISIFKEFIFSTHDDDYGFLKDHIQNGTNMLPEAAIIVFAWKTLADNEALKNKDFEVVLRNVKFYKEIIIKPEKVLKLTVTIQKASSKFEVTSENYVVSDGFIEPLVKTCDKEENDRVVSKTEWYLHQKDIYTLLSIKGYSYGEEFQNIKSTNNRRNKAMIRWNNQWITFLDSIIQLLALSRDFNGISTVKFINKISINMDKHSKLRLTTTEGDHYYNAYVLKDLGKTMCGGVLFKDVVFNDVPKSETVHQVYTRQFFAHAPSYCVDIKTALLVNLQIINENLNGDVIRIKEIITDSETRTSNDLKEITKIIPLLRVEIQTLSGNNNEIYVDTDVLIIHNFSKNYEIAKDVVSNLNKNTYILAIEMDRIKSIEMEFMKTVTTMHTDNQIIALLKRTKFVDENKIRVITTHLDNEIFDRMLQEQHDMYIDTITVIIVETGQYLKVQDMLKAIHRHKNMFLFIVNESAPKFLVTDYFYRDQIQKGLKVNVLKKDQWGSFCYVPARLQFSNKIQNVSLVSKEPNNIESLIWIEAPLYSSQQAVQVYFSGLSMKDYTKLCNKESKSFGMDFSGVDSRGNRVMGLLPEASIASTIEADYDLLWPVPQHWSLQEAATVPLPYVHAFYCLAIRNSLYRNGNIFITGAAGALGQAVIAVAQSLNCTVYGTVSNGDKKRFLLKLFPTLDENNIGYTYDPTFIEMVVARTNNKGCCVVINCGSGNVRKAAVACVGFMKCFLDANYSDQKHNEDFYMFSLMKEKAYKSVNLSTIFNENYIKNKKALQVMVSEGIAKGFVKPLTSVVYTPTEITKAFRLFSYRSNRGRVLINIKAPVMSSENFKAIPRIILISRNSYIVVCDGSVLSTELIDHLVQAGARKLLIHINAKLMNGHFHVRYLLWTELGATIAFSSDDLQTAANCEILMQNANNLGPIDGIFIAYDDMKNKNNMKIVDHENIKTALITSNLDIACRGSNHLRYFAVIFATASNDSNNNTLEKQEKCCLIRDVDNLPSLFLRHIVNDNMPKPKSLSNLFNAMESSLKLKYVSVLSYDSIDKDDMISEANTNFNGGLEVFFNQILEDELTASEPIVPMKTKSSFSLEHELLMEPDDTYILMIPGIEGNYKALNSVSERLKRPALALQTAVNVDESIPDIAKKLFNYLEMRIHFNSPFYIMGYSFGVNVALELASLFERKGLTGIVYCLDSSPDAMRAHLKAYLGNLTDEQLQNSLISHTFKLLAGHESTELKELLEKTTKWCDKIDIFINKVKNNATYSHQYLTTLIQAVYNKIKLAKEYKPIYKLESELILLKGILHANAEQLSEDYNLSKYTNKPVQVYNIESDHALALTDCRVANFINRTLVP